MCEDEREQDRRESERNRERARESEGKRERAREIESAYSAPTSDGSYLFTSMAVPWHTVNVGMADDASIIAGMKRVELCAPSKNKDQECTGHS